jgi:hypothetical protein
MTTVSPRLVAQPHVWRTITTHELSIRELALQVTQFSQTTWPGAERRSESRIPFPRLIRLKPLSNDDLSATHEDVYVVGKHLAPLGIDFYHHAPIPQRYAVVSLERANEVWVHFILKITWCRFLRPGWYDSGGLFIKVVDCSAEITPDAV